MTMPYYMEIMGVQTSQCARTIRCETCPGLRWWDHDTLEKGAKSHSTHEHQNTQRINIKCHVLRCITSKVNEKEIN